MVRMILSVSHYVYSRTLVMSFKNLNAPILCVQFVAFGVLCLNFLS